MESQLRRVDTKCRSKLLKYRRNEKDSDRIPLVLTFSNALPSVRDILKKRQKTLYKSDRMKEIFPDIPILAFRQDTNLQDILIHKKHNKMFFGQQSKCEPCGKSCALCPYIQDTCTITDCDGTEYNVRNYINCKSTNVIYASFLQEM